MRLPLHVLWVIHYPLYAGPHNRVLRLAPALARQGVGVTVVLPKEPGNAYDRLTAGGIDVHRMPLHRMRASTSPRVWARMIGGLVPEVRALRRLMEDLSADLVVVGGLANPHAAIAGDRSGRAVVWQVIDTRTPALLRRALTPLVDSYADTVQFGAQALIEQNFGDRVLDAPMEVLRPCVDVELFAPSPEHRAQTHAELGIPEGALVVGTVSNVIPQKGIEHFVRAAIELHGRRPEVHFVIVGAETEIHHAYAERIRGEIAASALPHDQVHFTGARSDIERYYPAFDVKVISSVPKSEGTTTTVMEAMACEVAVVSTDVGAIKEVVRDGVSGYLVPAEDPPALAAAVQRVLDDPHRAREMGRAGRAIIEEGFSIERAARRQLEIFDTALAHRRARRARAVG